MRGGVKFDTIPEQFDGYRPRYSPELFAALIEYAQIGSAKARWTMDSGENSLLKDV